MNNLKAKIHDECLEHESNIWDYVEMLGDQRVKNYETGEIEDLNLIIPILNGISDEVKRYANMIKGMLVISRRGCLECMITTKGNELQQTAI